MKIRLLVILSLIVWGWLWPDPVLAAAACEPEECEGTAALDFPIGCEKSLWGNFCETIYTSTWYVDCISDCRYPEYDTFNTDPLKKCAPGALPPFCPSQDTTVGPGTCCKNDPGASPPPGGCGTSAPEITGVNWDSGTNLRVSWTPGTGGSSQAIMASENSLAVLNNCLGVYAPPASGPPTAQQCIFLTSGLSVDATTYNHAKTYFTEGNDYWFKVVNVASPLSCSKFDTEKYTYTATTCVAGVPTNLAANWDYSLTRMELTWTPGGGTDSTGQRILASSSQTAIDNDCDGAYASQCDINYTSANPNLAFYRPLKSVFDEAGTIYYLKIINVANPATCNKESAKLTTLSTCTTDPPSITDLEVLQSRNLIVSVLNNPVITRINFTPNNSTGAVSVNPPFDLNGNPYSTDVTGVSAGDSSVVVDVKIGANTIRSCTTPVTVINPAADAWWQVVDGNVHADGGGVTSLIPSTCTGACKPNLITGATGLLSFNGLVNLNGQGINENGPDWQAETKYRGTQTGFGYFQRLLADDPNAAANGVEIYEDEYSTGAISVGTGENKIILVNDNVIIDDNITVAEGGFLAIIASGNITVADDVGRVEGVFVADGTFSSGTGDLQLIGEGIFTGWSGISLGRSLADNTVTPAEKFTYRPDLLLNAYRYLKWLNIAWREVAP